MAGRSSIFDNANKGAKRKVTVTSTKIDAPKIAPQKSFSTAPVPTVPKTADRFSNRDAYDSGVRGAYANRGESLLTGFRNEDNFDIGKEITSALQKKATVQQQLNTYSFENNGLINPELTKQIKDLEAEVDRLENLRAQQAGAAASLAQQEKIKGYMDKSGLGDKYFTQSSLKNRQAELEKEKKRLEAELAKMGANAYDAMLDPTGTQLENKNRVSAELASVEEEMRFIANSYAGLRDAETKSKVKTAATTQYDARRRADTLLEAVAALLDAPHTGMSTAEQNNAVSLIEKELGLSLESFGGDIQALAKAAQPKAVTRVADAKKAWETKGLTGEEYATMIRAEAEETRKKQSQASSERLTEFAEDYPVLSSVLSVVASPAQGVDFVNQTFRYAEGSDITNLDSYVPADTSHMGVTNFVSGIRSTVGGRLADQYTAEVLDQNVAEFLYNTGMSAADSMAQVATFGPASIYVMGLSSASNTAKAVIDGGGTNGQAFAMGMAAGVAEALCEKVSVDKLLDMLTADNVESIAQAVGKVLSQAGSEASEEFITEIANTIAEAYIMEGESSFRKKVAEYSKTMEERDAVNKALGDVLVQAGISGIAGALSGFASGAVVMGANVAPTATGSMPWVAPKKTDRSTPSVMTTSPAAAPVVQQAQVQAEATKQANPKATVVDAATTLFVNEQGCNLKTAEIRAGIVQKLIAGEEVSDKDLKRIEPTSKITQRIFTQLTGVQFPEGPAGMEAVLPIFRSAHEVAEQTRIAEQQAAVVQQESASPITQIGVVERVAQAQQVAEQVAPGTEPLEPAVVEEDTGMVGPDSQPLATRAQFEAKYLHNNPMASPSEITEQYGKYLLDGATVTVNGESMNFAKFKQFIRNNAKDGNQMTDDELANKFYFLLTREGQNRALAKAAEKNRAKVEKAAKKWEQVLTKLTNVTQVVLDDTLAADENAYIDSNGVIHLNSSRMDSERTVAYVIGHELVHSVKDADARKALVDDIIVTLRNLSGAKTSREDAVKGYQRRYQDHEDETAKRENREPEKISYEYAEEEYAADLMRSVFLDSKMLTKLSGEKPSLIERAREIIDNIKNALLDDAEASELRKDLESLKTRFAEALKSDAAKQKSALEKEGVAIDTETESAYPDRHSLTTWLASDYVQDKESAATALSKALSVDSEKAAKYIEDVNGIAKLIANNKVLLDYEAAPGRSSFVSNVEYGGSIDFSTICKKRRLMTGTFSAIQRLLPNTPLSAEDMIDIRRRMKKKGYEVSCGLCYVEGSRLNLGDYAAQFLDQYKAEDYAPELADLTTADGQEALRLEHPEVYEAYISYLNTLAQRKPKVYQTATAYNGEILKKFGNDTNVKAKNENGGLRLQSFSDFEIIHLIDNMQVIMDMARVGLAGQAYTKVPDFAWALGNTGLKINLSLIAKDVDENGALVLDEIEGMPKADAQALRDAYSDNVGTIIVVFNDAQLKAAMADEFIDYIIPFHRSQLNKQQYEGLGLPERARDYTLMQNESYIEPVLNKNGKKTRPDNYMPNTYWDFSKTGKENAEAYLKMCAENNRRPKFSNVLEYNGDGSYSLPADGSADGYWKLLIDFKMYNNEGVGVPQQPVKPEFNIEQANRMLDEYKGGHSSFPVAQDIVDEFVSDYKSTNPGKRYSIETENENQSPYSYETLIQKPSVGIVRVPIRNVPTNGKKIRSADIAREVRDRMEKLEGPKSTQTVVDIPDLNTQVGVPQSGVVHGMSGNKTNSGTMATAEVTYALPEILRNSVAVNELNPRSAADGEFSYVLFGYAEREDGKQYLVKSTVNHFPDNRSAVQDVEIYDILKGIKARKMEAGHNGTTSTDSEVMRSHTDISAASISNASEPTISVAELLEIVKDNYPELLPQSVRKHFEIDVPPQDLHARYSVTPAFEEWFANQFGGQSTVDDQLQRDTVSSDNIAMEWLNQYRRSQEKARSMSEVAPAVGAAELGFDPYSNLQNKYGTVEPGENPTRVIDMPAQTKDNNKVSLTPRTVMEAAATPESRIPAIEDAVVDHKFSYTEGHNKIQINRAVAKLKKEGWEDTLSNWTRDVRDGKVNADLVAMGAVMLNNAGNSDMSGARYTQLLVDYTNLLRSAGQATQASRIFKNLTPEARLYGLHGYANQMNARIRKDDPAHNIPVEKWMEVTGNLLAKRLKQAVGGSRRQAKTTAQTILSDLNAFAREAFPEQEKAPGRTEMERLQDLFDNYENYREAWEAAKETLRTEYADKPEALEAFEKFLQTDLAEAFLGRYFNHSEVRIDGALSQEFLDAKTDEERDAVIDRIIEDIARQIPATKMEKFTALRYLNMLGNFKTQGRNVLGNTANLGLTKVKNQVATFLEVAVNAMGGKVERTKSFTKDKASYQAALKDFEKMQEIVLSGGKYQDGRRFDERIEDKRTIFKSKALESYRKATNWAMTQGDLMFSKVAYADALAGYLTAHGKTFETAGETLMEQARAYAVQQAAEATFRDSNMFSDAISGMRFKNPDTLAKRAINTLAEGLMPFRKTPANILVRAVEYSPVGILTTAAEAMYGKRITGSVNGSKLIDSLAKNITGTGLVVIGYVLANSGLLKGAAPDDEKEKAFEDLTGHQAYSIELPNGMSLTLDWLAPSSIPLFLGAQIAETAAEEGMTVRTALDAIGSITDPMLQMSMLQGLDDALSNASTYGDDSALVRFTGNALWSFMTQGLTNTMLGQLERSLKNERSTTYRDKNKDLPDGLQYLLGKTLEKVPVPFVDYGQIPYIDAWGRVETNAKTDFGNVFTQFASPSYVSWVEESDMEKELQRLFKATDESSVLISRPKSYFNVDTERKDLTAEEFIEYATTRGQTAYVVTTDLTESVIYETLTEKQKAAAVEKAYDFANQLAKATVTGYDPSKWDGDVPEGAASPDKWVKNAAQDAAEYGISVGDYVALYVATKDIESFTNDKGETVDNSKSLKLAVAIYDLGLGEAQTEKLMEDFGVNKTVRGYSEKMTRRKLEAMKGKYE